MDTLSPEKRYCKVRKRKTKKCLDRIRNTLKQKNKENDKPSGIQSKGNKSKSVNNFNAIGKVEKVISNGNIKNISKSRINIKHGFFAKGARSETFSRVGLSEEFKARSEGNLYKIIDLANGKPEILSNQVCTIQNIENQVLPTKMKSQDGLDLFSNVNNTKIENIRNIEVIQIKSPSPILKSEQFKLNLRNKSVGHISPIKFSSKPSRKSGSKKNLRTVAILKSNPRIVREKPPVGDYTQMYTKFAKNIAIELRNKLPTDIIHTTSNLIQYLKSVNSRSLQDLTNKPFNNHCSNIQDPSQQCAESIRADSHDSSSSSVLLNPMQYLKKVNKQNTNLHETSCLNINYIKQTSPRVSQENWNSNDLLLESDNDGNGGVEYMNNTLFDVTPNSSPMLVSVPPSSSSGDEMRYSRYDTHDVFTVLLPPATPQPVFYPRPMNFNK